MENFINILGNKIRTLRKEKNFTLKALADKIQVTASLISQVERGIANPSISTLKAISDVLEVSIAELLDTKANKNFVISPLFKKGSHRTVITGDGNRHAILNPGKMEVEVILVEFSPRSSTGKMAYEHSGYECGYLLEGKITIELEGEQYIVTPGDSFVFNSNKPHKIINMGDEPAKVIWINTVPWIFPKRKGE